jgi:predicted TIM-barrel fold metal-dependent hydrolase
MILLMVAAAGCTSDYYTVDDFYSVEKIDTHTHLNAESTEIGAIAVEDNFRLLTINVDVPAYPTLAEQHSFAVYQCRQFPDHINFLTAFSLENWGEPDFANTIITRLDSAFATGALGIKLWKNIGMVYRDSADRFIMVDDPAFDPIMKHIISKNKTVLAHIGEPRNCWLPLEEMTVNNDRSYFQRNPQYHMFLHPEYPSHEELMAARDRLIEKFPEMRFVGAHLGSLEWDVDVLAQRLDQFENMAVDVAARVPHLQFQSQLNREKVRDFMIRYQDRIIYATDRGISANAIPEEARKSLHDQWVRDWKYFATDEQMTVDEVDGQFQGLMLPREVIDKLYRENAIRWFRIP